MSRRTGVKENGKTAYLKLYETLREKIQNGTLSRGERLPSRRQLAQDYGLSGITVEHSLELLCQEGYTEARPRSGVYVIYREADGFAQPERSPEKAPPERQEVMLPETDQIFPFPTLARAMSTRLMAKPVPFWDWIVEYSEVDIV